MACNYLDPAGAGGHRREHPAERGMVTDFNHRAPPRRSTVVEIGDHSPLSRMLSAVAASPSRIKIIACHLCDSITTITRAARTRVSATARAIGNHFAASGAARHIA